jgi:hypothetical protein
MLNWDLEITKKVFQNSERKIVVAMNTYQSASIIPIYISFIYEKLFKIPSGVIFFNTINSETNKNIINYLKISEDFSKQYNINKIGFYFIKNDKIVNFKPSLTLDEINDFILTV